jgi:uncharacterized membrane protein
MVSRASYRNPFVALGTWALGLLWLGCTETPTPPEASYETAGLLHDSDGIWVDTIIGEPFADMPVPFRTFYGYCSQCHSDRGGDSLASAARASVRINTWQDAVKYGPSRLIMAAKTGAMPVKTSPQDPGVSKDILNRVEAYLASWTTGKVDAISGCRYPVAVAYVTRYCADCHTAQGQDAARVRGYKALPLDVFADWQSYQKIIEGRIRLDHPGGDIMPPKTYGLQPSAQESAQILQWLAQGSPNTPDGTGQGDTLPVYPIVTEGAVRGLVYERMRLIINRSCADCHTQGGKNKDQKVGWENAIKLDTYAQWSRYGKFIRERIDTAYALAQDPPYTVMPKYGFPYPLTQEERQLMLDWIDLGSPNTPDGMPNDSTTVTP